MPALGLAQETGILVEWLKTEGDAVTQGEPLMEIETDKATVEIEAAASGTLAGVEAQVGDEIPVGQTIAWILAPGETLPEANADEASPTKESGPPPSGSNEPQPASNTVSEAAIKSTPRPQQQNRRIPASPKARRLAKEHQLNLADIIGSGPAGAVLANDVLQATSTIIQTAPAHLAETDIQDASEAPMSRMWQVMARRLTESWQTVPHFYLEVEANTSRFMAWHKQIQPGDTETFTYTDLLVKVVAAALDKHPQVNAKWVNDKIYFNDQINIGLAVAVEDGLLVPVIHQADQLSLNDIAARRKFIIKQAQANKLSLPDMSNGTFTISNLGMFGIDGFSAIVNPPQAAILAVGQIAEKVVAVNGQAVVQPMMRLTLSCDHRVVDGVRGAQFLQTLKGFIEEPLELLI
ncbi:MAG: dihydrolipoamide acetyltransferase family protein [Chloroflexota bacterium]